jgi:predicted dienelactone hydrolase
MRKMVLRFAIRGAGLLSSFVLTPAAPRAESAAYAVGLKQVEYVEPKEHRPMWMAVFYPAAKPDRGAVTLRIPFVINVNVYVDAAIADDGVRHPLIMLSHARGSDAWQYAWVAEQLAADGYIVAALNHYRGNTYEWEIAYLASKIWQRPIDVSLDITYLLEDPFWKSHIDAGRIGVAGHSQGGFTSLWIGGARVNPDKFLAFQQLFISNRLTPPKENAEFAARNIPDARLWVIPGPVGHEIFTNECDDEGKAEFPEGCIDHAGVDRHKLHDQIAAAALKFFSDKLIAH